MKIWQLRFELDEYDNLIPIRDLTGDEIQSFDGRRYLGNWRPLLVKRMEPEKNLPLSDAPGFTIPVFSRKAVDCLLPLMGNCVEVLPLDFPEKEYYAINVIEVLAAINYEKAEYKTFRDGKRIMMFKKYAFIPEVVADKHIFKITDEPRSGRAFVSESFIETVQKNGLTGFKPKLVWDSEVE